MLVKPKARNSLMLSCTSSSVVKSGICGTLMVTLSGDNNRLAHSRCCSTADLTPVYLLYMLAFMVLMSTIHSSTYGANALTVLYEQRSEVSSVIFQLKSGADFYQPLNEKAT